MAHDSPVDQVAQLVADARQAFARDVDDLLAEFNAEYNMSYGGTLTREDWRTFRRILLEKFDQRLPLKSHADPVLVTLVRDALEILSDDDCKLDRLEWRKSARKILQGELPPAPIDPRD